MSNPFHSFHVQSGGIRLKKLANHYRNLSKHKTFQPLMLQENKDLVVPMDLLHVPPSSQPFFQPRIQPQEEYYVYPEQSNPSPPQNQLSLEIVKINIPSSQQQERYPVIDDDQFEEMFQIISTTPSATKKSSKQKSHKKHQSSSKKNNNNNKSQKKRKRKTPKAKRL